MICPRKNSYVYIISEELLNSWFYGGKRDFSDVYSVFFGDFLTVKINSHTHPNKKHINHFAWDLLFFWFFFQKNSIKNKKNRFPIRIFFFWQKAKKVKRKSKNTFDFVLLQGNSDAKRGWVVKITKRGEGGKNLKMGDGQLVSGMVGVGGNNNLLLWPNC